MTSIDVLHEAIIDDNWNIGDKSLTLSEPWTGVTRFALLNKKTTRRVNVGLRQTDEETGHNKTRKHLARRMVKHVRQLSAQSHEEMGRRKNPNWMQREQTQLLLCCKR